jgi:hypothetical protein
MQLSYQLLDLGQVLALTHNLCLEKAPLHKWHQYLQATHTSMDSSALISFSSMWIKFRSCHFGYKSIRK